MVAPVSEPIVIVSVFPLEFIIVSFLPFMPLIVIELESTANITSVPLTALLVIAPEVILILSLPTS